MQVTVLKGNKFKPLIRRIKTTGGRSYGEIVSPRRGNLCKRLYRFVDFKRIAFPEQSGIVLRAEYNPKPRNHLCLVCFPQGFFVNHLLPAKITAGAYVKNYTANPKNPGDSASLRHISPGTILHGVSLYPLGVGMLIRSSGSFAVLVRKDHGHALLKLKSGELRFFNLAVTGTIGSIGDEANSLWDHKKAGTTRLLGKRPRVRPSAMNPVDHPMGGRTRGGSQPTDAKGRIRTTVSTKGYYDSNTLFTPRELKFKRF